MANGSPQSFSKYDELGPYHWRKTYGASSLWKYTPQLAAHYEIAADVIASAAPPGNSLCLDLGCGDGVMVGLLARRGYRTIGMDLERSGLALARQELTARNLPGWNLIRGNIASLPIASESIDVVTAIEVIEHLDAAGQFVSEVRRVLRKGGLFVLTTPNAGRKDTFVDPYHVHEFLQDELAAMLSRNFAGAVKVFGARPMWLDQVYHKASPWRPLELAVRLGIKTASRYAINPFVRYRTKRADENWSLLVGMARND